MKAIDKKRHDLVMSSFDRLIDMENQIEHIQNLRRKFIIEIQNIITDVDDIKTRSDLQRLFNDIKETLIL